MNKLPCFYALSGINYKNSTVTCCPRQANQLVFQQDTVLPSEIYNHSNFKNLRKKLYDGIWPSGCDTCEEMESNNLKSMRLDNRIKFSRWKQIQEMYNRESGIMPNEAMTHIELRFSNACNFSCLHCSDVYSSKWNQKLKTFDIDDEMKFYDLKQLLGTEHRHGTEDNYSMKMSNDQIDLIVDDLCKNFKNLELIDIAGGEPLFQKQFWHCLEKLTKHPNAKNIVLTFHSNFNTDCDIEKLSFLLNKFKYGIIIISIDGGENIYEYFRKGGKWSSLSTNIKKMQKIDQKTHLVGTCTTSAYQIMDIENTIKSILGLNLAYFDTSIVQTPKYMNPSILSTDFKKFIIEDFARVEKYIDENVEGHKKIQAITHFDSVKNYTLTTKLNYHHYNRFLVYIKKTDQIWNQNFNDFFTKFKFVDQEIIRI